MRKLYEIREDIATALNPSETDEEAILTADQIRTELAALEIEFADKIENCIGYIKNLRSEEEAVANEIRRLTARKRALQNKQDSIKEYTLSEIEQAERTGFSVGPHKARIAKSQDAVIVEDEHAVPDRFVEIVTKVDKRAILKWYKSTGEIVAGTDIITDKKHLRVS